MYRILVLDADKLIRWSIRELFSPEDCLVHEAESSEAALYLLEKSPYSMIFADFDLIDESEEEFVEKVAGIHRDSKIVIMTSRTKQQTLDQIQDFSPHAVVEKPFQTDELKSIAKTALDLNRSNPNL